MPTSELSIVNKCEIPLSLMHCTDHDLFHHWCKIPMRKLIKALAKDIHCKIKETLLIHDLGSDEKLFLYKPFIFFFQQI